MPSATTRYQDDVLPRPRPGPIANVSFARWKYLRAIAASGHYLNARGIGTVQHDWAEREGLVHWKRVDLGGGLMGGKYALTERGADTLRVNSQ